MRTFDSIELYINGGIWNGSQIIPEDWAEESVKPHIRTKRDDIPWWFGSEFGYLWNLKRINGYDTFYASGWGGQFLFGIPELNMIIVITSTDGDTMTLVWSLLEEYIFRAL